jgi:hypothetical protein
MLKIQIKKFIQNLFYNWEFMNTLSDKIARDSKTDMVYWITSRVNIEKTLDFLKRHQEEGINYWTLAQFIDEETKNPMQYWELFREKEKLELKIKELEKDARNSNTKTSDCA